MDKSEPSKKYMKIKTAAAIYDFDRKTLRDLCLKDYRLRMEGTPEQGPFHGRAVKIGSRWFVPVAEMKRMFREAM